MNMLYRATRAKTMEMLTSAFKKLESATPNADANELLDVLMYRGNPFGGLEWDDRFQPELVKAGQDVPESHSNAQALMDACRWTNGLFNPDKYGMTFTLRDSIEWKQLDCNRATDMIGAIFRNAGRARFGNIRWCAESTAHTVAAYLGVQNNTSQTLIVDALDPKEKPEVWPDAYFSGHKWPDFMPQNPPAYAVELYGRGLDNYIWLEGYVVRGPNAGYLTTAAVPFSQIRQQYTTQKVFDGPYPK